MAEVVVRWRAADGTVGESGLPDIGLSRGASWRWVDVTGGDEDTFGLLAEEFSLHPLLVGRPHEQRRPVRLVPDGAFAWLTPEHTEGDGILPAARRVHRP
jgi:hypothetical protein